MYIKVVEAEYINSLDRTYEKGIKEGKEFNKDNQNLNYRMGYNDGWHNCEASFELGNEFTDSIQKQAYDEGYDSGRNQWQDDYGFTVPDNTVQSLEKEAYAKGLKDKGGINESVKYEEYKKGYEHGVQHMKMQNSIDKYLEMSDKLSLTEDEVDNIIDEAFEEGYAQAYSEIQAKTEREQALQEKSFDEGYDQAIDDLLEAGVIGEEECLDEDCSDECYSEYEFGDIENDEEEYCFLKELDEILNNEFTSSNNFDGGKKDTSSLEEYNQGYEDGKSRGITLGYNKRDYEYSKPNNSDEDYSDDEHCFSKELDKILKSSQEQYEADPSVPSMGNRYDENGNLCGFFINTGNEKNGGIKGSERKHSHYFKDVRHLDYVDVYQVCKLFPVDDDSGAITHARKKLLVAGGRGAGKDMIKDITEARDTLNRYLQIEGIE